MSIQFQKKVTATYFLICDTPLPQDELALVPRFDDPRPKIATVIGRTRFFLKYQ